MLSWGLIIVNSLAALLLGLGGYLAAKILRQKRWPSVTGRLEFARVVSDGPFTVLSTGARSRVEIGYYYDIEGKTHFGDSLYDNKSLFGEERANALCSSISKEPRVYFNPNNHKHSFLLLESLATPIIAIVIGLSLAALNF